MRYLVTLRPRLGLWSAWTSEAPTCRPSSTRFLAPGAGLHGLENSIITEHTFTPLDLASELGSHLGAAFSIEPTLFQSAYFRPHNRSNDIGGLYFVGAGTHPGAGVPGVLLSADITSRLVIDDLAKMRKSRL